MLLSGERLHPRWFPDVARMILDRPTWEWVNAGSAPGGEVSADLRAYRGREVVPRVLLDVSDINLTVTVAGEELHLPMMIAPMGLQRALHPEGESGLARATAEMGTVTVVAASTSIPIEEIAAAVPEASLWLQLPNWAHRASLQALIERAVACGVRALVPLVNAPVPAAHVSPEVGFRLPAGVTPAHLPATDGMDATRGFEFIEWLVAQTSLPVIPKGIMHPMDARQAVDAGARAIIVSNHGCRQLPSAVGTLDALPRVVDEVGHEVDVVIDGGVRSGSDVLVALASGARAVLLGRPMAWALAVGGSAGVIHSLTTMREELVEVAALSGVTNLAAVSRELLAPRRMEVSL
jgi:4-hydroxymandelate oxidase